MQVRRAHVASTEKKRGNVAQLLHAALAGVRENDGECRNGEGAPSRQRRPSTRGRMRAGLKREEEEEEEEGRRKSQGSHVSFHASPKLLGKKKCAKSCNVVSSDLGTFANFALAQYLHFLPPDIMKNITLENAHFSNISSRAQPSQISPEQSPASSDGGLESLTYCSSPASSRRWSSGGAPPWPAPPRSTSSRVARVRLSIAP